VLYRLWHKAESCILKFANKLITWSSWAFGKLGYFHPNLRSAYNLCVVPLQTVQSQQRAERDAAISRLEQSRLVLAMRLAEHQGKRYRVIDEALAFVGEVSDKSRFISPEDVCATQTEDDAEDNRGSSSRIMSSMLSCSLSLAKNSFRLDKIGGALGNAAVFAVSMLAFLQLHQIAFGSKTPAMGYRKRIEYSFQSGSSQQNGKGKHLEVYLARG